MPLKQKVMFISQTFLQTAEACACVTGCATTVRHIRSVKTFLVHIQIGYIHCIYIVYTYVHARYMNAHLRPLLLLLLSSSSSFLLFSVFRLLKEAGENIKFHKRYQLMFGALMSVVGDAMRKQFQHQEALVRALSSIAEKVKTVKDSYKEVSTLLPNLVF